jgi:hypothetical protein
MRPLLLVRWHRSRTMAARYAHKAQQIPTSPHRLPGVGPKPGCCGLGGKFRLDQAEDQGGNPAAHTTRKEGRNDGADVKARGRSRSADPEQGAEDLPTGTSADRTRDGVSKLPEICIFGQGPGGVANNRAADELNNQRNEVHIMSPEYGQRLPATVRPPTG